MVSGGPTAPQAPSTPGSEPAVNVPASRSRWRGPALFASLALNLFLIGIMIGGWAHHRHALGWIVGMERERDAAHRAGGPRDGGPSMIRQAIQALPEADRHAFEQTMAPHRAEIGKEQQEIRTLRQRANEIVRAETFDRAAFLSAMAELRRKQQAVQESQHGRLAEALSKISPESRRQFADRFGPRPRP